MSTPWNEPRAVSPGPASTEFELASCGSLLKTTSKNDGQLYRPIVDPLEIRVIEIKPGSHDDKLQASLHHCLVESDHTPKQVPGHEIPYAYALSMDDLKTPIFYTALSYAWGPPVFEGLIECDGHQKAITKSLEAALRNFRKDRSIVMWIDQLCIDQGNHREKEQQIPLMGKIYQHAFNTVIWLGESSPAADSAIKFFEDAGVLLQWVTAEVPPSAFERIFLPKPDSEIWRAAWDLISRPWFTRLWIIQEVMLSLNLWVACGRSIIGWRTLEEACVRLSESGISRWVQEKFSDDAHGTGRNDLFDIVRELGQLRTFYTTSSGENSLFSIMVTSRYAQCYDMRDRVYGFLGVCSNSDRAAIRPSYAPEFTAAELYHHTTRHQLADDLSGWRLAIMLTSVDHDSPDLPSWVPNWNKPRQTTSLGFLTATRSMYNSNGRFLPRAGKIDFSMDNQNTKELQVRGIFVDTLVKTSDVFTNPELTYLNPTSGNTTLLEFGGFISQLQDYPGSNTIFSAFWHTLVAGKDGSGRLKCPDSFEEIISLLLDASTGQTPSLSGQTYSTRQKRPAGRGRLEPANLASRTAGETFKGVRMAMKAAMTNRRLGISQKGYLGLFPGHASVGDRVYVLDGCHVPFLLRAAAGTEMFRLVGECYVHGIMGGEAVAGDDVRIGDIILV